MELDSGDTRRHLIRATARLHELADEYSAWMVRMASENDEDKGGYLKSAG
jgi:hypothetical protein